MWQKVNPIGFRVWITKSWASEWYAKDKAQSSKFFIEDIKMRQLVETTFPRSWISKIVVRRTVSEWEIIIFTSKLGVIMGKDGSKIQVFQNTLNKRFNTDLKIVVKDVRNPELSARIMAEFIASQIEARMPYRRVAKSTLLKVIEKGALWIKIQFWWRLQWNDMAQVVKFSEWRVSLQTIRSEIDYFYTTALTKYGIIGVKVWISKGDVFNKSKVFDK